MSDSEKKIPHHQKQNIILLAETGCTVAEISAFTGLSVWATVEVLETYRATIQSE
jgi:hypothetical protein